MKKDMSKNARLRLRIIITVIALLMVIVFLACILFYNGVIHVNNPSKSKYPIRGVDVSHYQGEINWERLAKEDIRFAYIKATEGSTYVDECFEQNWKEAHATELRVGAYHFFSMESAGLTQAESFCRTVVATDDMLPPVVDVEPYGNYGDPDKLDKEKMLSELGDFIRCVESHYSMKPVIYTTRGWLPILQEKFSDYDVWIRSVYGKPDPSIDWTFWQYSNRHVLAGYSGKERFIDMNVFDGSEEDFINYR